MGRARGGGALSAGTGTDLRVCAGASGPATGAGGAGGAGWAAGARGWGIRFPEGAPLEPARWGWWPR